MMKKLIENLKILKMLEIRINQLKMKEVLIMKKPRKKQIKMLLQLERKQLLQKQISKQQRQPVRKKRNQLTKKRKSKMKKKKSN